MEKIPNVESQEEMKPVIELHFFRHDDKEKDKTKSDTDIELTPEGKNHAKESANKNTVVEQSIAFGSPRKRAQETSAFHMSGASDEITGNETLEELKEKLNKDLKVGSKISIDKRLDFDLPPEGEFFDAMMNAFKSGELLKFLVDDSERLAKEVGVGEGHTYTGQAKNIAKIVEKYLKTLPRWDRLVNDEEKDYKPKLERFFGSHQTVTESFLARVIELTKGVEERNNFVKALNNNGFDFSEGFDIKVFEDNGEEKMRITFKKEGEDGKSFEFDEVLSRDVLDEILEKQKK